MENRGAWCAAVHEVAKSGVTVPQQMPVSPLEGVSNLLFKPNYLQGRDPDEKDPDAGKD